MDDHKIELADLFQRYNTNPTTGLTDVKAREIFDRDGPNTLSWPKPTSKSVKFFKQMFGGFGCLIWLSAILCFIADGITRTTYHGDTPNDNLWLGITLIIFAFVFGCISCYQAVIISEIMDLVNDIIAHRTTVIRNGEKKNVKIEDLVAGDIVEVKSGEQVPADIRILESYGCKIDTSCIGNAPPRLLSVEFTNENPMETNNLAFFGSFAVAGTAKGLVLRTGDRTVMGGICSLFGTSSPCSNTMVPKKIDRFICTITGIVIFLGISFFIIALSLGYPFIEAVIFLLVIVVANVPKGHLIPVTICLTLTAKQMTKRKCLVKDFQAIENLSTTSIICSNKTGTLTQNHMTVSHIWLNNQIFAVDTTESQENVTYDKNSSGWLALCRCAMLCNRADFKQDSENLAQPVLQRKCNGDGFESALLKYVELSIGNVIKFRENNRKVCEIPFNSMSRYQVSIHQNDDDFQPYLLVMKGAPERILQQCSSIFIDGINIEINDYWRDELQRACIELGSMGESVLGFCDLHLSSHDYPKNYQFDQEQVNFPLDNLRFLGLMSMIDHPRVTVPEAVAKFRSAGIKVIMITNDHPITAKAIARSVGIMSDNTETVEDIARRLDIPQERVDPHEAKACVIHGNDLQQMHPDELDTLLRNHTEIVFARTFPYQKFLIIEGCQRLGAIVTVIGDSDNDLLALKKSDIGAAMGIVGSERSKNVADMILLDDDFTSLMMGIKESRLVFENLKKSMAYTLTSNIPKSIPFLIYLVSDIPLPLGLITVLYIDMIINLIPPISLVYEKAETYLMKRGPRKRGLSSLISIAYGQIGFIQAGAGFFSYFVIMAENGFLPSRLVGLRKSWESKYVNDLQDSYGQEWTYEQRRQLEFRCHIAFFIAIIICQWAVLIIFKTRRNSILQQGMNNWRMNFVLVFEIILLASISCMLYSYTTLNIYFVKFRWWLPALPFAFLILIYDEIRKYLIRKHPDGWIERENCY